MKLLKTFFIPQKIIMDLISVRRKPGWHLGQRDLQNWSWHFLLSECQNFRKANPRALHSHETAFRRRNKFGWKGQGAFGPRFSPGNTFFIENSRKDLDLSISSSQEINNRSSKNVLSTKIIKNIRYEGKVVERGEAPPPSSSPPLG